MPRNRTSSLCLGIALAAALLAGAPAMARDYRAEAAQNLRVAMVRAAAMPDSQASDIANRLYRSKLQTGDLQKAAAQSVTLARQDRVLAQYYWSLLTYFAQQPNYSARDVGNFIQWSATQDFVSAVTRGREGSFVVSPRHHQIWGEMSRFWGAPYVYGGESPRGTDCSGFTMKSFARAGILLRRTAREQFKQGIPLRLEDLAPGDLVFFDTSRRNGISHVGIYLGENRFAHSASSKGVAYSYLQGDKYWWPAYRGARRLF